MTHAPARPDFRKALFDGLVRDLYRVQPTNVDYHRFRLGLRKRTSVRAMDAVASVVDRLGLTWRPRRPALLAEKLVELVASLERFERVYELLSDAESRDLWLELIRYKTLGPRRVRLRRNSSAYWNAYRSVDDFLLERDTGESCGNRLNLYEARGREGTIRVHSHPIVFLNTFVLAQYSYENRGAGVRAEPGDVVLDGGACWGDTALAFADAVGERGHVHCFEFVPENVAVLEKNLALNPSLAERISVHEHALWDRSDQEIGYDVKGPGTSLLGEGDGRSAKTTTIDDFVAGLSDERVDFIKLDIEDAELAALAGATRTIRASRPKLAVAMYHSDEEFTGVPERIAELEPAYRLFLDHFTVHDEETVLYGTASAP